MKATLILLAIAASISPASSQDTRNLLCYDQDARTNICPEIACNDTDVATDTDDVCVSIPGDDLSYKQTVTIRECTGETKKYCMWGQAAYNKQFIWPFSQEVLINNVATDYVQDGLSLEARCVDEDYYFQRSKLLSNFPCINDLECYSKKCSYGYCLATSEGGACFSNADCIEGLSCRPNSDKIYTCQTLSAFNETCENDYDCIIGYYCNNQNSTCNQLFAAADAEYNYGEPLYCLSGGNGRNDLCDITEYTYIGGFYDSSSRSYDDYKQLGRKDYVKEQHFCVSTHTKTEDFGCAYSSSDSRTNTNRMITTQSPFVNYILLGQQQYKTPLCGEGTNSVCLWMATQMWVDLHQYYRDQIVPNIQNCHTDFRYDPQWWLFCRYTEVTATQVSEFSDLLQTIIETLYPTTASCIRKVSPYYQKPFLNATLQTLYIETKEESTTVVLTMALVKQWQLLTGIALLFLL